MTTYNIKTNYGAVGNTQSVQLTCTMSDVGAGRKRLTVSGGTPFVIGDVGKKIGLCGSPGGANLTGDNTGTYVTTIASFVSATAVNLTDACPLVVSSQLLYVTWGTDDSAAFRAFAAAHQGEANVQLDIPVGGYLSGDLGGVNFTAGIPGLVVNGADKTLTWLYGDGQFGFGGWSFGSFAVSSITDRKKGSSFLTRNANPGDTTIFLDAGVQWFTSGQVAIITGIDTQGDGEPQNPAFLEFITLTNVNLGTGQVDFIAPGPNAPGLNFAYKTTWPCYNPGSDTNPFPGPNLGGPGTLYTFGKPSGPNFTIDYATWNMACTLQHLSMACGGTEILQAGRTINTIDCDFIGSAFIPTQVQSWNQTDCTQTVIIEFDKVVGVATWDSCQLHQIQCFSSSGHAVINDCAFDEGMNGTPITCEINNSIGFTHGIGATANGASDSFTMRNSKAMGLVDSGARRDYTFGTSLTYDPATSTIFIPNASPESTLPSGMVPGHYCFLWNTTGYDCIFLVNDLTATVNGTTGNLDVTVHITSPFGMANTVLNNPGTLCHIHTHPAPLFYMSNCDIPDWDPTVTYSNLSEVKGSDGACYYLQTSSSLNQDPTTNIPSIWLMYSSANLTIQNNMQSWSLIKAQNRPWFEYSKRYFDGRLVYNGGTVNPNPWTRTHVGRFVKCTVDVIQPYTGSATPFFDPMATFGFVNALDPTLSHTLSGYGFNIDLRTPGVRVITPTSNAGGGLGNDSFGPLLGNAWFAGGVGGSINNRFDSDPQNQWAIWSVEFETDQGIPSASSTPTVVLMGQSWT